MLVPWRVSRHIRYTKSNRQMDIVRRRARKRPRIMAQRTATTMLNSPLRKIVGINAVNKSKTVQIIQPISVLIMMQSAHHMGHLILGFNVIKISMVTISALTVRTLRLPMPIQTRGGTNVSPLDRINATKASIWLKCPIRGLLPTRDENLILKPNQTLTPFLHSKHVAMNHGEVIK